MVLLPFHFRINRNIVECKFSEPVQQVNQRSVLIETLWNVNKPRLMDWEQDGDMY